MPKTIETRICDRPGCGATFTPAAHQLRDRRRGMTRHTFCSYRCFNTYRHESAVAHPPASSYSDAALVAEMRERTARGLPMVWPAAEFRAPSEADLAREDRAA